jgi:hypothetical protein
VLSQYPLAWVRSIFPTAGRADAVLVGVRKKLRQLARLSPGADEVANSLVLPTGAFLEFGDSTERLSDWPRDKVLRRFALLRNEIQGKHDFVGPKLLAFERMLRRAREGKIIVVVLPLAPAYSKEFVTEDINRQFEKSLERIEAIAPKARVIRLDKEATLSSDEYYSDFVHLNAAGRRIATQSFLEALTGVDSRP